jgi:acetyl esterase/lipase
VGVGGYYGEFPTPRSALGLGFADQTDLAAVPARAQRLGTAGDGPLDAVWSPPAGMRSAGLVSRVDIPAPVSGFDARPGWVYLPPAYLSGVRAQLPVLVAGADDAEYRPQAERVAAALAAAGVPAPLTVLPGAHTWDVWGPGLEVSLPWLGTRLGLTR